MSEVRCLHYVRGKRGNRCGRAIDDPEMMRCERHARRQRERLRLRERTPYAGHYIVREWRTNAGDLRDDWYFYVSEHTQVDAARHSVLERHLCEEIDRCLEARLPRCNAYTPAPPRGPEPQWDRFKLSRGDGHQ